MRRNRFPTGQGACMKNSPPSLRMGRDTRKCQLFVIYLSGSRMYDTCEIFGHDVRPHGR